MSMTTERSDPKKKGRIIKAIPYGLYDVLKKQGFVSVGVDHNTAEFAVASLTNWWSTIGSTEYTGATDILLFCDSGSSNGSNNRLVARTVCSSLPTELG